MKIGDKVRVTVETSSDPKFPGPPIGEIGEIVDNGINGPEVHWVHFQDWKDCWTADYLWAMAETQMELIEPDKPE